MNNSDVVNRRDWIFPQVRVISNDRIITFFTRVRIKHTDGKWYFVDCYAEHTRYQSNDSSTPYSMFMQNVYMALLFTKVDPELKDFWGKVMFEQDTRDITEQERMCELMPHLKKYVK